MWKLQVLFRILAVLATPFALFQFIAALGDFLDWLRIATDTSISHGQPTAFQHFATSSLRVVYGTMILAVPLLMWLAGERAAKVAVRGDRQAK